MIGIIAQGSVGLDVLKHLITVHIRHHDVEQDKIERLRDQALECLTSIIRRREVLIALAAETSCQRVTIVLIVVDDKQRGFRIRHFDLPLARALSIFLISRSSSIGLLSKSSQPAANAFSRSPVIA